MTTTVIDSLVLQFGLDTTKFVAGSRELALEMKNMREQAKVSGDEIEAQGKAIGEAFSIIKREAVGVLAAFFGGKGMVEFFNHITQVDAATGRLAKTINMSTRELSAWQGVSVQTGGTADSMAQTLQGLTGEINKFLITGQGAFIPVFNQLGISLFDSNRQLKTAGQLILELSEHANKMDPARFAALMSMIPGMNSQTINTMLQGDSALRKLMDDQVKLGLITEQDAQAAIKLEQSWARAEQAATSLGRRLVTFLQPALTTILDALTKDITHGWLNTGGAQQFGATSARTWWETLKEGLGWRASTDNAPGISGSDKLRAAFGSSPVTHGPASVSEREAYIRKAAAARGMDPEVAVKVARSEGLGGAYVGDRGSSFGDFQLHYGGVAGGGMAVSGLGDAFTKKTGLDARDPGTWQQQVDFALDQAKAGGWGPWHGWKGSPSAGIGGPASAMAGRGAGAAGGGAITNSTTIGSVNVYTSASDGEGIARDIKPAIERQSYAAQANSGLM
jgi:hypothetical protein